MESCTECNGEIGYAWTEVYIDGIKELVLDYACCQDCLTPVIMPAMTRAEFQQLVKKGVL